MSGGPCLRDHRKFVPKKPGFLSLIAVAAISLATASASTPTLVTLVHAQTPSPTEVQIVGMRSVATSRAFTNFSDLTSRRPLARAAKYLASIAIHRLLAGRPGESVEGDEVFGVEAMRELTDNPEARTHRRNRPRVRAANFPAQGDTG